jgi:methylenetetrahydrofolate dehydrogenase (NADP+)/methenyltetrahydrofolate cyclohydrolase/formyltetrahydrofolate synthetase
LLKAIDDLNSNPAVHGILVQLPLPKHISEPAITSAVSPFKDVDGFQPLNIGELAKRGGKPYFIPCTPKGVMVLLEESKVDLKGKRAVVLGRSDIVGKPVSYLLDKANATVTVCHSNTPNVKDFVRSARSYLIRLGVSG